jgi:hypothetical protein
MEISAVRQEIRERGEFSINLGNHCKWPVEYKKNELKTTYDK